MDDLQQRLEATESRLQAIESTVEAIRVSDSSQTKIARLLIGVVTILCLLVIKSEDADAAKKLQDLLVPAAIALVGIGGVASGQNKQ